uniref:Uncharacterized protein n=1 Tax=Rhizophora mucronata TaxID=61149 RepID=A0A2P2K893_RHIMU
MLLPEHFVIQGDMMKLSRCLSHWMQMALFLILLQPINLEPMVKLKQDRVQETQNMAKTLCGGGFCKIL